MAAQFERGPNLKSKEIVRGRVERLARVNKRLLARGVIPELLVITSDRADDGISSYIKSLDRLGPKVHAEVSVKNVPDDRVARRRLEESNHNLGATLIMVPLKDRAQEEPLLALNGREIEGIRPGSRFAPSTPNAMIHLGEYGLGHSLLKLDDPERDIVVVGNGRSVGKPLVALLGDMGIHNIPVITDADDPEQYRLIHGRKLIFSGMGRPDKLGAAQFGVALDGDIHRYAVDVGVKRVGAKLHGDISPTGVAGLVDLMYTPPWSAAGPMNAITMLERTTLLTAEAAGMMDEFDVAMHSLLGLRDAYAQAA